MIASTHALLALALTVGPQAGAPDQGITSPIHRQHVGKIVFAKAEIPFKSPDPKGFERAFSWPGPIYGRAYLPHSLATEYANQGWRLPGKPSYRFEVAVGGEVVWATVQTLKPEWSTFQLGLAPAASDKYKWPLRAALRESLARMQPGANAVTLTVYAVSGDKRSAALAKGAFGLTVAADVVAKARASQGALRGFKTTFRSGDDVWKEWTVTWGAGAGRLKTSYRSGDDVWKEWRYEGPGGRATIKTTFRAGDDVWKAWRLERDGRKVDIKTRFRSGSDAWLDWVIVAGQETWTVKTRFRTGDDRWREWVVTGPKGKLELTTRFRSGDDFWKEWVVTDRAPDASADVKLAVMFTALYAGALRHK